MRGLKYKEFNDKWIKCQAPMSRVALRQNYNRGEKIDSICLDRRTGHYERLKVVHLLHRSKPQSADCIVSAGRLLLASQVLRLQLNLKVCIIEANMIHQYVWTTATLNNYTPQTPRCIVTFI